MTIPDSVLEQIRADAKEAWPDDRDMQVYTVKEEIDAYRSFETIDYSGISESEKELIVDEAKENSGSWEEIASAVEDEVKALVELKNINYPNIDKEILDEWCRLSKEENETYFRGQLDFIKSKAKQYEAIQETRREIDPVKQLLIDLEGIVGNECYNSNIQNYGSWGVLESEGRSFRYPVKFWNGETDHKEWNVTKDIPSEELITGYYPFGANELNIYRALHKALKYLEKNYGLKLPKGNK
ncbi:MAG: hypothetical protein KZQ91_12605 [Candidatus Thiodiazotropha sp. (ex Lucinoma borealis)]|nr:hypothetical protein [Candidatus Thiodiazotropha sp. (ex Lucinoma borealis)]